MVMLSSLELIRRVPLFAMLSAAQADSVAQAVSKCRFKRGAVLVEQGQKSDSLTILLSGRARVFTTDARGREVILATLQPGDCIGEMSLIDDQPHSATVRAETQSDALLLGRNEFLRCLYEDASMAQAVLESLVRRLRSADQKIESLALMDVYGRVARVLIDAAVEDEHQQWIVREKISRQDLAKMVGASREMVSRVMKDLEERGFVQSMALGGMCIKPRLGRPV